MSVRMDRWMNTARGWIKRKKEWIQEEEIMDKRRRRYGYKKEL